MALRLSEILVPFVRPETGFRGINDSASSAWVMYHASAAPHLFHGPVSRLPCHATLRIPSQKATFAKPNRRPKMNDKSTTQSKQRLDVFVVDNWTNSEGAEQANWIRLGTAFAHK